MSSSRLVAVALALVRCAGAASTRRRSTACARSCATRRPRARSSRRPVVDKSGRVTQSANGEFLLERPGKFRWSVAKPYKQLLVGDGQRVWIFDEDLNQVIVRKIGDALGATPAALLSGNQDVERAFTWKDLPRGGRPRLAVGHALAKESTFPEIRLGFDANGLAALELFDAFGQTSVVRFTELRAQSEARGRSLPVHAAAGRRRHRRQVARLPQSLLAEHLLQTGPDSR